jgi:WD40 repeat protein
MAASLPDESRPAKEAASRYRQRIERRPWMRWVNKPQTANPCIMTLSGHEMVIRGCSVSPTASIIASASDDKTIRIWNAATGEETKTLKGHTNSVVCCEFSPNGQFLASAGYDKQVKVWNVQTGDEIISLKGHKGLVNSVAWSPDGSRLATSSQDKTVKIWDPWTTPETACVHTITDHSRIVRAASYSADGTYLASGCEDGSLRIFNVATGYTLKSELSGHAPRGLNSISFCSAPGKESYLVTAGDDRAVRIWNVAEDSSDAAVKAFTGHHDGVTSAVWSSDGERVLSASHDNLIMCFQVSTGATIASLLGHTGSVFRAVFTADGKHIVSCSFDRSVKVCFSFFCLSNSQTHHLTIRLCIQ